MSERTPITSKKLIVTEGKHAEQFLRWACRVYRLEDVQVQDGGGVKELRNYLRTLKNIEGFEQLETLVVARDAEGSAANASQSVRDAFKELTLPIPDNPFSFNTTESKRTAFILFPGPEAMEGTLEDLCLKIVSDDPILSCVEEYLSCVKKKNPNLTSTHDSKRKISTFLAGQEDKDLIGTNPGEAANGNAWDAEHPAMAPLKQILIDM
jgi:hypothetical protein